MLTLLFILLIVVLLRYGAIGQGWRARVVRALRPAFLLGAVGFAGGFFGPMIFAPWANQGPMLGIFITGPLGFIVGLAWGIAREIMGPRPTPTTTD